MQLARNVFARPLNESSVLCANSLSGAVDVIDKNIWEQLKETRRGQPLQIPANLMERLRQRGYLFSGSQEEILHKEMARAYTRPNLRPLYAVLVMTYNCQLRCPYCFEVSDKAQTGILSSTQIAQIFEAIQDLRRKYKRDSAIVRIFGGEPLQEQTRPAIEEVLRCVRRDGHLFTVTTNGLNLIPFLGSLAEYRDCLQSIQVTLDGPREVHDRRRIFADGRGSFDRVVENMEATLKRGLYVTLRINVDRDNIESLPRLADYMEEREWQFFNNFNYSLVLIDDYHEGGQTGRRLMEHEAYIRLHDLQCEHPSMRGFIEHYNSRTFDHIATVIGLSNNVMSSPFVHYCRVGTFFAFDIDNGIAACPEAAGKPELVVGSYAPHLSIASELEALWHDRAVFNRPRCATCPIAGFCGGGCAFAAQCLHGSPAASYCNDRHRGLGEFVDRFSSDILKRRQDIIAGRVKPFRSLADLSPSEEREQTATTPELVSFNTDTSLWIQAVNRGEDPTSFNPNWSLVDCLEQLEVRVLPAN